MIIALCYSPFCTRVARADSLKGILEFDYSNNDLKTTDSSGRTTRTESNSYGQQYRLSLNKSFYPNLVLNAGGLFEKVITDTDADGLDTTTTRTRIRPFVDLRLSTPLYVGGGGYSRREDEQKTSGFPSLTIVNEEYFAILGWRPEGFPVWNARFETTNTFDKDRVFQDTRRDRVLTDVRYEYKGLGLRYQFTYSDTDNRIEDLDTKERIHSGRATYSGSFFEGRTTFSASYEISRTETETITGGGGEVTFPLFPLSGLSVLDDTPEDGTLDPNPSLIDGNLTASSGLNLGLPPPGGDARQRNMGLDFVSDTETNTLFVWIDRELPVEIANAFSWEIYTSPDNLNWNLETTVSPAPFGPFQNRFEIHFPNVTARYIKAVTRPLPVTVPGATSFPDIFVTEIQAFLRRPAAEVSGETTRTAQNGSADLRLRLLDRPQLYYEFSFFLTNTDPPSRTRYTISNGLSAFHRFSKIFSASGRFTREDIEEDEQSGEAYIYNASLRAVPLKTLSHTLLFSGRNEELGEETNDRISLFLRNTAQLYKGIDVFLDGGVSRNESGTGEKQDTKTLNYGANLVPHRTMTLTLNFTGRWTDRTGGGQPDDTRVDKRGDLSVAYRPFQTVYLLASVSRVETDDRKETLQNYVANWSPFPSGSLRFNFAFTQDLSSENGEKSRTIRPSVRWNVTNHIFLDLSYQLVKTESTSETTDLKTFNTNLRMIY